MTTIVIDKNPKYVNTKPVLKNVKVRINSNDFRFKLHRAAVAKHEAKMLWDGMNLVENSKFFKESLPKEAYDFFNQELCGLWHEKEKAYTDLQWDALVHLGWMLLDYIDVEVIGSDASIDALKL